MVFFPHGLLSHMVRFPPPVRFLLWFAFRNGPLYPTFPYNMYLISLCLYISAQYIYKIVTVSVLARWKIYCQTLNQLCTVSKNNLISHFSYWSPLGQEWTRTSIEYQEIAIFYAVEHRSPFSYPTQHIETVKKKKNGKMKKNSKKRNTKSKGKWNSRKARMSLYIICKKCKYIVHISYYIPSEKCRNMETQ